MAKIQRKQNGVPKTRVPQIFLTPHPLTESLLGQAIPLPGSMVSIPWNTTKYHKRKFICRKGKHLVNNHEVDGKLFFWGEYEAESEAMYLGGRNKPQALHTVLIPARGKQVPNHAQNTDPYVFGNHFKHICCGIGHDKFARKFQTGDVVIFGGRHYDSNTNKVYFLFDTVIVIKDKYPINYSRQGRQTQYFKASIEPIIPSQATCKGGNVPYYYRGIQYSKSTPYFSFVPCCVNVNMEDLSKNSIIFSRPALDLVDVGFTIKPGAKIAAIPFTDVRWKKIIKAVIDAHWEIGTHIDKI